MRFPSLYPALLSFALLGCQRDPAEDALAQRVRALELQVAESEKRQSVIGAQTAEELGRQAAELVLFRTRLRPESKEFAPYEATNATQELTLRLLNQTARNLSILEITVQKLNESQNRGVPRWEVESALLRVQRDVSGLSSEVEQLKRSVRAR